jgi:tetratricopeptide (TPR) repeat protein
MLVVPRINLHILKIKNNMKNFKKNILKQSVLLSLLVMVSCSSMAQTFTMSKKCRAINASGIALLQEKKYQEALDSFIYMGNSCKTKDAKEAVAVGEAEAYNGLGKYDEAITASDAALKVSKNKSLMGYFQKATAQYRLGQVDAARATFGNVIALTEKNENVKARASNYALLGVVQYRQLHQTDSAFYNLDKAMELDPDNPDFYIDRGDIFIGEKKYDDAFVQYDKAVALGKTDMDMYVVRTNARMKMVQDKYHTTNTQELRSKMTTVEKEQVCTELKKAISLGLKDMKYDMFASLVCK